jgi:polysaccharide export outer membrane protein
VGREALMMRLLVVSLWIGLAAMASAQTREYRVQEGDRLEISVLEDPGLNRTVLVRPDGRISLPLAGAIQASGNTPEQVQELIRRSLARQFVTPPTVTVSLVSLGAPELGAAGDGTVSIYVLGQVSRPGVYQVAPPIDALKVLALAGGPGVFAARHRVQVRRRGTDGGETVMLLDYDSIERGLVPSAEILVTDGDVIVVPERRLFE